MATSGPPSMNVQDYTLPQLQEIVNSTSDEELASAPPGIRDFISEAKAAIADQAARQNMQTVWFDSEYPAQADQQQMEKVTDREQKVQVFPSTRAPMNRERLGVANVNNVAIGQGAMNPTLRNVTYRNVVIDSRFRLHTEAAPQDAPDCGVESPSNSSTVPHPSSPASNVSFTVELTETLHKVLSIKLQSLQIPSTWYAFSADKGTTFMQIREADGTTYDVHLQEGNYTPTALAAAVETAMNQAFPSSPFSLSINEASGTLSIASTHSEALTLLYYSEEASFNPCKHVCSSGVKRDRNLGWRLGLRDPFNKDLRQTSATIQAGGKITGASPVNVDGPTHFIIVVDDFNQNRLNKGIVGTQEDTQVPSLPSYATPDIDCDGGSVLVPACAPRRLTQAKRYSLQEIMNKRRDRLSSGRLRAPTTSNVLAVIQRKEGNPVAAGSTQVHKPMVETSSVLQLNTRTYFGPVSIDRLKVDLIDSDGDLVNLNGRDWNMVLRVEQLYQY